jgi:phosphoribosyl 1,2-cyclic phosphodiesterase
MGPPPPGGPIATANHLNHERAKRPGNDAHPQARLAGGGGDPVRVKVWGARGSVPTPGPSTNRYGGNTSCLQVTLSDGRLIVLDAGSGIRNLGLKLAGRARRIDILLTHLHLDHIQGLMFFAPLFVPDAEIVIWGPAAAETLLERLARYLSPPLTPLHLHELPARISFRACPKGEWEIGPARIQGAPVAHPGLTHGYRISEGDTSLCYIPDQELALGPPRNARERQSLPGFDLAHGASLLVHDCQYTDDEYPSHVGWGHSRLGAVLAFARLTEARRVLLFHHDPLHDDEQLDRLHVDALARWSTAGRSPHEVLMAAELQELELDRADAGVASAASPTAASRGAK